MASIRNKVKYYYRHWKLATHLILKTKHFGVNNLWWSKHQSYIGNPCWLIILNIVLVVPVICSYQALKVRSTIGWVPFNEYQTYIK